MTGLAGGIWRVILVILQQSKIVLCAAVGAGRIETAAAAIYEGTAGIFRQRGLAG